MKQNKYIKNNSYFAQKLSTVLPILSKKNKENFNEKRFFCYQSWCKVMNDIFIFIVALIHLLKFNKSLLIEWCQCEPPNENA